MLSSPVVIAALVGFFSAVITSLIAGWIGYRKLKSKFLAQHRAELIKRQISACESLWSVLEPLSFSDGPDRVIKDSLTNPRVTIPNAKQLSRELMRVFYSPAGLYYSRSLRDALFGLRDFIRDEFIAKAENEKDELEISKTKRDKFRRVINNLRVALRNEIGTKDLNVTQEGPIAD